MYKLESKHQHFWDLYQESQERRHLLTAAVLGHYQALCSLEETEFKKVVKIIRKRCEHQYYLEMLKGEGKQEARLALKKQIKQYEDHVIALINKNGECPKKEDIQFRISLAGVSIFQRFYCFLKNTVFFLDFAVYGSNNFIKTSQAKRRAFVEDLKRAESGHFISSSGNTRFDYKTVSESHPFSTSVSEQSNQQHEQEKAFIFSEYNIVSEDASGPVLEALRFTRTMSHHSGGKKNVVIYVAGRSADFTTNFPFMINNFWSMTSCDDLWQVNLRNVSLRAGGHSLSNVDLEKDLNASIDGILSEYTQRGESVNITLMSHCAGCPIAAEVSKKRQFKFFSDRSFISVDSVADTQFYALFNKSLVIKYIIFYGALPLRLVKRLWIVMRDLNINQGRTFLSLHPCMRALHVTVVPKGKYAQSDSMHLDLGASLHKAMTKEDGDFDNHFLALLRKLGCAIESSGNKAEKKQHLEFYAHNKGAHASILKLLLDWHKDRKSYVESGSVKKDPHNQFASGLTARGSGVNPFWRVNLFVNATEEELRQDFDAKEWDPDLRYILQHEKALFVHLMHSDDHREALNALNTSLCQASEPQQELSTAKV